MLFLVLCGLVRSGHRHVEAWAPPEAASQSIQFLPSGKALGLVAMGYDEFLADLLWVRTTILFGDRFGQDEDLDWYSWLYHMMDLATDLDPQFRAAYKYGGIMLRVDGVFVDQSTMMFAKGMHAMPDEWYFPFGVAMNYFMYKGDRRLAGPYMQRAALAGEGPFYLRNLAASLMDGTRDLEVALAFLEEEMANLQDGPAKNAVRVKIVETQYLIAERDAGRVISEYRRRNGRLPAEPKAVLEAGFELPADPLGGTWIWNRDPKAEFGSVHSSNYYTEFGRLARESGLGALGVDFGIKVGAEGEGQDSSDDP